MNTLSSMMEMLAITEQIDFYVDKKICSKCNT